MLGELTKGTCDSVRGRQAPDVRSTRSLHPGARMDGFPPPKTALMGVWVGPRDGMKATGQCYLEQVGLNRSSDEMPKLRPVWPVILFVGAGECAELPPTPEVGGVSAFCSLRGHPCPDEVNSPFPIATDHERLSEW